MEEYTKVCKISELRNKIGKKFVTDNNVEIAIFRVGNDYFAVSNVCPHNHSPLISEGFIDNELYVICPVHCYRFSLLTGRVPAGNTDMSGKLDVFKTKVIDDELWVEKRKNKISFFDL